MCQIFWQWVRVMAEFLSGDFVDGSVFTDNDFGYWSSDEDGGWAGTVMLALRVCRDGRVQARAETPDRWMFGELSDSSPRLPDGPGVCRYCSRRVFDEGQAVTWRGSDALRLHEFWDHLDLFQTALEREAAARVIPGVTRRRGKRGKEAIKMKKRMEAESAPVGGNLDVQQQQQISSDTNAPSMALWDPAKTCYPEVFSIDGAPIQAFHLDLG